MTESTNMTLSSWLNLNGGLITYFSNSNLPNKTLLDIQLALMYGERTMFSKMEDMSSEDLSELIEFQFNDKWDELIALQIPSLDSGTLEKITNNKTINVDGVKTSDTTNKVSAYNDDELIVDSGNSVNDTDAVDTVESGDTVRTTYTLQDVINNLSLSQKTNIITVVLNDIANYITHNIY